MAKSAKIKAKIKELEPAKRALAERLLSQIDFMDDTLSELQEQINEQGAVIITRNGNGFEVKTEHPAQKSYNTMIGRYNAMVKSLFDMLPDEDNNKDELMEYLKR